MYVTKGTIIDIIQKLFFPLKVKHFGVPSFTICSQRLPSWGHPFYQMYSHNSQLYCSKHSRHNRAKYHLNSTMTVRTSVIFNVYKLKWIFYLCPLESPSLLANSSINVVPSSKYILTIQQGWVLLDSSLCVCLNVWPTDKQRL